MNYISYMYRHNEKEKKSRTRHDPKQLNRLKIDDVFDTFTHNLKLRFNIHSSPTPPLFPLKRGVGIYWRGSGGFLDWISGFHLISPRGIPLGNSQSHASSQPMWNTCRSDCKGERLLYTGEKVLLAINQLEIDINKKLK